MDNVRLQPDPDAETRELGLYLASVKSQEMRRGAATSDSKVYRFFRQTLTWLEINIYEPIVTTLRFVQLSVMFCPVLLTFPFSFVTPPAWWYKYLKWTMEWAGPTFIKLGQWAASRTDIFPDALCKELSNLHSNAKQHSLAQTKRIITHAFHGRKFEDIFDEFIEKPLGVGAMGQVYEAKLKKNLRSGDIDKPQATPAPEESNSSASLSQRYDFLKIMPQDVKPPSDWVAIKVLHPGVERLVDRDLTIMRIFAALLNSLPTMEWLSLPGEVETFSKMMRYQLDLRIEAENLSIFRHNFADQKDIKFPKSYPYFSSRYLLVEEHISGIPMTTLLKRTKGAGDPIEADIASKGLDAFLKMLLLDNFIHSDLHPGNIYVQLYKKGKLELLRSGDKTTQDEVEKVTQQVMESKTDDEFRDTLSRLYDEGYRPQVCFLDAGLVTELTEKNRKNFLDLFITMAKFDGYRTGELMIERSRTPETAIDPEVFALRTEKLLNSVRERTFALGSVQVGDLLAQMFGMVRKHHVRMESDFITVILSILLLEGIGRQLDPNIDIFKSSIPILRKLGPHDATSLLHEQTISMAKVWLTLEVRQFINASVQDIHNLVKTDGLCPNN